MNKFSKILKIAVTAFAAIGIIKLISRWVRVPNRLFFYSPRVDNNMLPTGAVATLSPDFFSLEPSFTLFEDFDFVTLAFLLLQRRTWMEYGTILFHVRNGA